MPAAGGFAVRPAFRVALSADLFSADSQTSWGDIGLDALGSAGVQWDFLPPDDGTLSADAVAGYDAVLFAAPAVTADTVAGTSTPLLLARFGVGLDAVDVAACTAAGVAVTITPDGARRAVATAALTLMLAVGHRLLVKHRLVVDGNWAVKQRYPGTGLTGKTVGTIGFGHVAKELFTLLQPFATVNLTASPRARPGDTAAHGVELVELDDLLRRCDVVVVTAGLNPGSRGLVDAGRLGLMSPHAVLVNVSRGAIVDTGALVDALAAGRLGGAGLDVFEEEPLPAGHPLTRLDNVVLSPHALAWTDEMAGGNGASAVAAILAVRDRRVPMHLADPSVLRHPRFGGFG